MHIDTGPKSVREALTAVLEQESWDTPKLERALANVRLGVMAPFAIVYFLVAFFVLLGSLHDDRRDRSVLFWKSLPLSDAETVVSKFAVACIVIPLVAPVVKPQGLIRIDRYGQDGDQWQYPYPLDEENYLVTFRPAGEKCRA